MGFAGIFETIATLGTASAAKASERFPVDMAPKPIGGAVVPPTVPPPTQGEVMQLARGLLLILSSNRGVKQEAAQQLALAIAAVCGPQSALTPDQQGQAVNQILSVSPAVDKAVVPQLYGLISLFVSQQPVALRRDARRGRGRKVIGESIFGNYLFANDALPMQVEQPWSTTLPHEVSADVPEPVTPRGVSGFGDDVAVDHAIPTGMKWLGHGIMGGRTRHGGYATSRYGEPVTGYGMGAAASGNTGIMPLATSPPGATQSKGFMTSGGGTGVVIGLGVLALVGGALLTMGKKKPANAGSVKSA